MTRALQKVVLCVFRDKRAESGWDLCAVILLLPSEYLPTRAGVVNLAYWHRGEADPGAVAGNSANPVDVDGVGPDNLILFLRAANQNWLTQVACDRSPHGLHIHSWCALQTRRRDPS